MSYITDEDRRRYAAHTWSYVQGIFESTPAPNRLWHYTTGQGLIKIIGSGELWATQIANLNDAREFLHSVDLFRDAIVRRRKLSMVPEVEAMFDRCDDGLRNIKTDTIAVFVVCFSTAQDDLSQWRAYSGGEGGYAIEFDGMAIGRDGINRHQSLLVPVRYEPADKARLLDRLVADTERFFLEGVRRAPNVDDWSREFLSAWADALTTVAPLLKHESFRHEKEWRLVYQFRGDFARMQFTQPRFMLRRHMPLAFADKKDNYTPLPLLSVLVGPTPHPDLCRIGTNDLLRSKGYDSRIEAKCSTIPYRVA